jgi:hypothetical protein
MSKRILIALPLALGLMLAACSWIDPTPPRFEVSTPQPGPWEGQVTAINAKTNSVSTERKTSDSTVYLTTEVRPATDLQRLHVGDRIAGRIVVEPHDVYITDVKIIR